MDHRHVRSTGRESRPGTRSSDTANTVWEYSRRHRHGHASKDPPARTPDVGSADPDSRNILIIIIY